MGLYEQLPTHGRLHGTKQYGKGQQAGRQAGTYHFEEVATETVELETETSLCRNR